MKRTYIKPAAKFIDYSYDEQVVADSSKVDGLGDGYQLNYCTWESASYSDPCDSVLSKSDAEGQIRCFNFNPWSLR